MSDRQTAGGRPQAELLPFGRRSFPSPGVDEDRLLQVQVEAFLLKLGCDVPDLGVVSEHRGGRPWGRM